MSAQRIFVTGATGLVGTAISEALAATDHEVTAVSRQAGTAGRFRWVQQDLADPSLSLLPLLEGVDVIIHNAACLKPGASAAELEELENVNITLTARLLEAAAEAGVGKFIHTGSFSHLAKPLPQVITEDARSNPQMPYATSKWKAEQLLAKAAAANSGLQAMVLRIPSPISTDFARMPETVVKKWIAAAMRGESLTVFGKGGRTQDFVAVSDIAAAFVAAIDANANGVFNIASGTDLSMLGLAQLIADAFGSSYTLAGEDPQEADRWKIDISKAQRELGYAPRFTATQAIQNLLEAARA